MRKKSILSVGALVLTLGLGFAAINASGLVQLPFAAAAVADGAVPEVAGFSLVSSVPANDASIAAWEGISQFELEFSNGQSTFPGIEINTACTQKIQLQKADGAVVAEIDPLNPDLVSLKRNYETVVVVNLPEGFVFPDLKDCTYKLVVPQGVFKQAMSTELSEDGNAEAGDEVVVNKACSISFTIADIAKFTTVPEAGTTVTKLSGALENVEIVYEEGSSIVLNPAPEVAEGEEAPAITLYYNDPAAAADASGHADTHHAVGTYTPVVDGNIVKLSLTLFEGEELTITSRYATYEVAVPAGMYKITTKGSSVAKDNTEFSFGDIKLIWIDANDLKIVDPELGEDGYTFTPETVPTTILMQLPMALNINGNPTATFKFGNTTVANYKASILPNGTTVEWKMVAPTSLTSVIGNPQYWENGDYTFNLPNNAFVDPENSSNKTTACVYNGFKLEDGREYQPLIESKLAINAQDSKIAVNDPADFNLLSENPGFSSLKLQFLTPVMKVNPDNLTAKIALYKDGVAEPVWEQVNDGKINHGHLWSGKPSSYLKDNATSSTPYIYYNVAEDYGIDFLTTPGSYTIKVDKGFFVTNSGTPYENDAIEVKFTIVPEIKIVSITPDVAEPQSGIKDIVITYEEGAKVTVNQSAEAGWYETDYAGDPTNEVAKFSVSAEGNVVTLSLPEEWTTLKSQAYMAKIAPCSWNVEYNGTVIPNSTLKYSYKVNVLTAGKVTPAAGKVTPNSLETINYVSRQTVTAVNSNAILYQYKEVEEVVEPTEGNDDAVETPGTTYDWVKVYEYKPTQNPNSGDNSTYVTELTYQPVLNGTKFALEDGQYKFVIPAASLKYLNSIKTTTDFEFEYQVVAPSYKTGFSLTSSVPANDAVIPNWDLISQFELEFSNGQSTFPGIEVNTDNRQKIQLQKADGTVVTEIDPLNSELVSLKKNYETVAVVNLPEGFEFPDVNDCDYKLVVPQGVFKQAMSTELSEDGNAEVGDEVVVNKECSVSFTIADIAKFTTVPEAGTTVTKLSGALENVEIVYEEGSSIVLNPAPEVAEGEEAPAITLYYNDPAAAADASGHADTHHAVGTYTPVVDGNIVKLALTLFEGEELTITSRYATYEVAVPAGMYKVTKAGSEIARDNTEFSFGDIKLIWIDANDLKIVDPELGEDGYTFTPETVPTTILMQLPMALNINGSPTATFKFGNTTVANYKASILPNGTTVEWKMVAPTSLTSVIGNPQYWENGDYTFNLPNNAFVDPENSSNKTTACVYNGFKLEDGREYQPLIESKLAINAQDSKIAVNDPAEFDLISANPGFSSLKLQFLTPVMKVNPDNLTAKIALYKDGQAEPIWEQVNDGKINHGHLWSGKPSSYLKDNATSSTPYIYYNVAEDYGIDFLTTPGSYTIKVDKGFFVTNSGTPYENDAIEVNFSIVPEIKVVSVTPDTAEPQSGMKDIVITYEEGAKVTVNEGAQAGWYETDYAGDPTNEVAKFSVSAEGNVVTLSLPEEWTTLKSQAYLAKVAPHSWDVELNEDVVPNGTLKYSYKLNVLRAGTVTPAPTEDGSTVTAEELETIQYVSRQTVTAVNSNAELYQYKEVVVDNEPSPLEDGDEAVEPAEPQYEWVKVYEYKPTQNPNSGDNSTYVTELTYQPVLNGAEFALEDGQYKFVIPAASLKYLNSIKAPADFEFEYEVAPAVVEELEFNNFFTLQTMQNAANYEWLTAADEEAIKLALNTQAEPLVVTLNGEKVAELPAANVTYIPAESWAGFGIFEGDLKVSFADPENEEAFAPFNQNGTYELVIPDGFMTYDGKPLAGTTVKYENHVTEPGDETYVLTPSSEEVVTSLDVVAINVNNSEGMDFKYNVPLATLKSEDGSVDITVTSKYAGYGDGTQVSFKFGEALAAQGGEWVSGKYTLTVMPDVIYPDEYDQEITFSGCEAEYILDYVAVKAPELIDHIEMVTPVENANWDNTDHLGMSKFVIAIDNATIDVNRNSGDAVILNRDNEFVGLIMPGNREQVNIEYRPMEEEDEFAVVTVAEEFYPVADIVILFSAPDWDDFENYNVSGTYSLEIPDGTFALNGVEMKGTTLTYIYDDLGSGVALVGIDGADSYNVFTVDGKVVKLGAAPAEMLDLENGLYIINGKKVYVRK